MLASLWRTLIGLVLTIVMVATLLACAVTFSARSFQHNFAQISGNATGVVSLAAIGRIAQRDAETQAALAPLRAQLTQSQRAEGEWGAKVMSLGEAAQEAAARADLLLKPLEERFKQKGALGLEAGALAQRISALSANALLTEPDRAVLAQASELLDAMVRHAAQASEASASLDRAREELSYAQGLISARESQAQQQEGAFTGNFDQIRAEIEALEKTSPYGMGLALAQIHPAFLSTLLACLSGALGAIFYLFPAFMAGMKQVNLWQIVMRWLMGVTAAFVFMIVANAADSLLGFGGAGAAAPQPSLNPFTIAGLGLVAGVMADDIAQWIHQRGSSLFSQGTVGQVVRGIEAISPPGAKPGPNAGPVDAGLGGLVNPHGGPGDPA